MEFINLKSKKDLSWFQDERLTTEFQAKYYDRLTSFRSNIKSEEERLLKQTLMRVKSIKIKDHYRSSYSSHDGDSNKENGKDKIKTPRKHYDSDELRMDVAELQEKLDKERLLILKKFQRNNIENARKSSAVNPSFVKTRSKSNMQQTANDERVKTTARVKNTRPKTTSKAPLLFYDSIDGYKIDIKNSNANGHSSDNNGDVKIIDLNRRLMNSRLQSMNNYDPDTLPYKSIEFPLINTHGVETDTPTLSSRREKLNKTPSIKQSLKPKSAKLLYNDTAPRDTWYANNINTYNRWVVDKMTTTNNKIADANNKLKSYYEHKKALTSSLPDPPSTTPVSQFYENESRPKTNKTVSRTPSSLFIRRSKTKTPNSKMHIKDLIKYMKPVDNQSLESKSTENMTLNGTLEFNEEKNIFLKSNERFFDPTVVSTTSTGPVVSELVLSKMNISSMDMKPEKFELSIKIPLGNEVY